MDLLTKAKRLLHHYDVSPRKRLGQNFLVNSALLEEMISNATVTKQDVVLEVGAGLGFLTKLLCGRSKRVLAVEVDPKLVEILREALSDLTNAKLIEGDILEVSIPPFNKVVSTPPYTISSPLLFWLLERTFDCAVLTFQKEFAERLAAPVGSADYGRLTVNVYYRAEVELVRSVPKSLFYPQPEVDSMIVRLTPRKELPFPVDNEQAFLQLTRILFTQRNKKVRNAIIPFLQMRGMEREGAKKLVEVLPFHNRRVRKMAPEDLGHLSNVIANSL
jgi:16S rRNA (adenine1518-N6/adenine1519-N6)-dimethyltransferase